MSRKLSEALAEIIRAGIPLSDAQVAANSPTEVFIMAAAALEGTREIGGNNRGPTVQLIQQVVGLSPGDSWCIAALQAALRFAENTMGKPSTIYASGNCMEAWRNSPANQIPLTQYPRVGDIIIYHDIGSTTQGHAEVIVALNGSMAFVMGNNTSAAPGISGDGDGTYFRMRNLVVATGILQPQGYLRPYP